MIDHPTIKLLGYKIFSGEKDFFSSPVSGVVNTLSPHSYIVARNDDMFREALMASDFLIPDGIGIVMAVKYLNGVKIKRITGSDIHEVIRRSLNNKKGSCFYLGSSDRTLDIIKAKVQKEHPVVRTGSFSPPFRNQFSEADNTLMINAVNDFRPDVLFVGMTAPKQEKWVHDHCQQLNVRLICSIGAVFDFYAGTVKRPGKFWISLGLEWLPRLLREPLRLWRRTLISTPEFIWCVLREKIMSKKTQG